MAVPKRIFPYDCGTLNGLIQIMERIEEDVAVWLEEVEERLEGVPLRGFAFNITSTPDYGLIIAPREVSRAAFPEKVPEIFNRFGLQWREGLNEATYEDRKIYVLPLTQEQQV